MEPIVGYTDYEFWLDHLRAGRAFVRGVLVAASVGNFSEIQFLNPAGSNVVALLYTLKFGDPAGVSVQLRTHNPALANLVGAGVNLDIGGAAGACVVRTATPAAADGTLISELHRPTDSDRQRFPPWVCQLDAGEGILLTTDAVNQAISAEFFWAEVAA